MNKQTAKELMMDYLYGEISGADKQKLEAFLETHPELREELQQLADTRAILGQAPEVPRTRTLTLIDREPRPDTHSRWHHLHQLLPHSGWGKAALAAAACVLLLLVAGAAANLQLRSTDAGFSVHMGYGAPAGGADPVLTDAQTQAIIDQIRQENVAILTEYADMLNRHNQQQLQQVVEYFERQRLNDLQLVDQALDEYQQQTDYQLQQTNQVLGQVLRTVASGDQQQP